MMPMLWFELLLCGIGLVEVIGAILCVSVCFLTRRLRGIQVGGVSRGVLLSKIQMKARAVGPGFSG
jgi:hypothetical protein